MNKKKIIIIMLSIMLIAVISMCINYFANSKKIYKYSVDYINNNEFEESIIEQEIFENSKIGTLTIPKINLYDIPICESVELETLSKSIGHFENTSIYKGNVGLASHNAGTNANYFANIHKLKIGDEIEYKTNYGVRIYKVDSITEIDSYDWSKLEDTEDNRITLITCISGKENSRLCVQAVEKIK